MIDRAAWSDRLHERVRSFAQGNGSDTFEALAWDIAAFQHAAVSCTRGLWGLQPYAAHPSREQRLDRIPAVPVEALRSRAVFAFEPEHAAHVFRTSGTTSEQTGRHFFRTTATYASIALSTGRAHLLPHAPRAIVAALLPFAPAHTSSSLSFMAQRFMDEFDAPGVATDPARWLVRGESIDRVSLSRLVAEAARESRPVLLLATSFALLALLDALAAPLELPPGSVVMPTGGFKGKSRTVDPEWLRARTERLLGAPTVVHEYGMTELSSQLYERTAVDPRAPAGLYFEAPTVQVIPVDPVSLEPVSDGQVGLASFVDLGNVDSAVRILTQDRVVREGGGIRLLGRSEQAPLRGCALVSESLLPAPRPLAPRPLAPLPPAVHPRRPDALALERVRRLVGAARVLADPAAPEGQRLREELRRTGPLSERGFEFGLTSSLETEPSEAELEALVLSVAPAARVWVVQSANVFVSTHRALALALAASSDVRVRPSRRDPVLTRALAALVPDLFQVVPELDSEPGDHVHAYGSDATLVALAESLPSGVTLLAHGDGIGVAWVTRIGHERDLALDVAAFDQRGCASPRIVALHEGVSLEVFLPALGSALLEVERELPRGTLLVDERAAQHQFRALSLVCAARVEQFGDSIVAVQPDGEVPLLPPIGRHLVLVTGAHSLDRLCRSAALITTVGVAGDSDELARVRALFPRARVCPVGRMQRPRFDGPLDLR